MVRHYFPPRLVLSDLRTDDGRLRGGVLPRLRPRNVSPRSSEGAPSLGHNSSDWWLVGITPFPRGYSFPGGRACVCITPRYNPWAGALVDYRLVDRHYGVARRRPAQRSGRCIWLPGGCIRFWSPYLFASIPVNRFLHVITGPLNIALRPERPMGTLIRCQWKRSTNRHYRCWFI